MGKKKPKQRVTEYYSSIQYAICHGIVEKLVSIKVNDKLVGRCSAGLLGPVIYINDPDLFGGIKKEGGLRGRLAWQSGTQDQLLDSFVAQKKGGTPADFPGYRGIATAYFTEWPGSDTPAGVADQSLLSRLVGGVTFTALGSALQGFLSGTRRPAKKGFYWSANQPIIPPTYFRVTRIDRSWLPEIAAIPGDIDLIEHAICIAIDCSLSMNDDGKLGIAKQAAIDLLRDLKNSKRASSLDVRVVGWNNSVQQMQFRKCTPENYESLISFVQGLTTALGTFFTKAVEGLQSFYSGSNGKCRTFIFMTDGIPEPGTVEPAAATLAATGAQSFAINLIETDTTYTAQMDSTPGDGVPVVSAANALSYLRDLFRLSATNQIDMNPAHMIRECLTNRSWGLGLPASSLDATMFEAAAQTLFAERFGLSMIWSKQAKIDEFIAEILSHIQGTIYVNPMTGKLCLKLIRNDYDAETLDVLTPSNCTVTSFKRRTPAEITNEISVTWTNPLTEKEEVVTRQSLGSVVANNGEVVSDNRNYYGVRRRALAAELCDRDLAAATAPLSTAEVRAGRAFSRKVPGDVVKLTDPENGASEIIMRIMKINYGYVGSSEVEMSLTEDVFSYSKPRFLEPQDTENENQTEYPAPPESVEFLTINTLMAEVLDSSDVELTEPQTRLALFTSTDRQDTYSIEVAQEIANPLGTSFESVGEFDVIGKSAITAPLVAEVESELSLPFATNGTQPEVGGVVVIGENGLPEQRHELAYITDYDTSTGIYTILRAVADTVPFEWPSGTPVRYLSTTTIAVIPSEVEPGVEVDFRVRTRTSLGILPEDAAPVVPITPTDRLYAPARPANVQVEGVGFGTVDGTGLTTINVTFARRNRLEEDSVLLRWDEADVAPEVGQTTTIRLTDYDTGITLAEYTGIAGTSHTFDATDRAWSNLVSVAVLAERDGYESIQAHSVLVQFPDFLRLLEDSGDERATETGDFRRTED